MTDRARVLSAGGVTARWKGGMSPLGSTLRPNELILFGAGVFRIVVPIEDCQKNRLSSIQMKVVGKKLLFDEVSHREILHLIEKG